MNQAYLQITNLTKEFFSEYQNEPLVEKAEARFAPGECPKSQYAGGTAGLARRASRACGTGVTSSQ